MSFINRIRVIQCNIALLSLFLFSSVATAKTSEHKLRGIINTQHATVSHAFESEKKIDRVADKTREMLDEYKLTVRQAESLRIYNEHLRELVNSQQDKLESSNQQLENIDETHREIVPLMVRMIDTLGQFVALDTPFLLRERRSRVQDLRELMRKAEVSVAEKYRRIMEAYQVESEYGRTIEAYRDTLDLNGKKRSVDFLRFGRIAFIYQTLDATKSGIWDSESAAWVELSGDYLTSITKGLKIARKQIAPDLLKLPIQAPLNVK